MSRRGLGCEYIDLIQCHDIEFGDQDQIVTETIPALVDLRRTGKVRFVGITGYPLPALARLADRVPIDTVLSYCRYTLLDRTLATWVPFFADRAIGVIHASPLAMGLLTAAGPPAWHPAPAPLRAQAGQVAEICRRHGVDVAEVALQFATAPTGFASTIVGASDVDSVTRNVARAATPIDPDLVAEIEAALAPALNLSWPSGRPENDEQRTQRA